MLEDVIKEYGGEEVTALEVYADVFRFGEGLSNESSGYPSNER